MYTAYTYDENFRLVRRSVGHISDNLFCMMCNTCVIGECDLGGLSIKNSRRTIKRHTSVLYR